MSIMIKDINTIITYQVTYLSFTYRSVNKNIVLSLGPTS